MLDGHENKGIVLAMVLVMTIVLSLVILSIVQMQSSQMITSQSVIDTIKSKELALGYFYQDYQRKMDNCALCPIPGDCNTCPAPQPVVLDGKTYTPQLQVQTGTGPEGTDQVQVSVTY